MAREYKDSGIEWIGRIPKDWKVCRIKDIFQLRTGTTPKGFEQGLDLQELVNWFTPSDVAEMNCELSSSERHLSKEVIEKEGIELSPAGSLIFVGIGASAGKIGYATVEGYSNQQITTLIPKQNKCFGKYSYYYMIADGKRIRDNAFYTTLPIINNSYLSGVKSLLPPLAEQQAIASYLDKKCAEIDSLVELQEQMIAQLTDYKQSVITEAVTKGLNPEAELVSSGIDWIGDYPKHWEIIKIGFIFDNLDYLREPISAELRERNNPQYDYYGASGVIDKIDHYNVDDKVLLIGEDGANLVLRNLPLIYKAEGKFWVNNHAHILKPKKDDYDYLAHALEAANYRNYITGSAQPKLSQENLQAVKLPIPPLAEQQAIASYLDTKCREIDTLISLKRQKIEMLKDYKKSIIFEAVTGKTDLESLALIGRNHWH